MMGFDLERMKKPYVTTLDQITITREAEAALIYNHAPDVGAIHLTFGFPSRSGSSLIQLTTRFLCPHTASRFPSASSLPGSPALPVRPVCNNVSGSQGDALDSNDDYAYHYG